MNASPMKTNVLLLTVILGLIIIGGCDKEGPETCNARCEDGYHAFADQGCKCPEDGLTNLEKLIYYARHLHDIDLVNDIRYMGWYNQDFWDGNTGIYTATERLVIAAAQIFKTWEDHDLYNNTSLRIAEVNDYCAGKFQRDDGTYRNWCTEFVSYVYRKAGMPLHLGEHEFWCHDTFDDIRTWFVDKEEFIDYTVGADRDSYTPKIGDYLNQDQTPGDNEGHSMLILGPVLNTKDIWHGDVVVVEGNTGGSETESMVNITIRNIWDETELRGVGVLDLGNPYIIIFDLNFWHKYSTEAPFEEHSMWRARESYSDLSDLGSPNANNKASSIYLANGVRITVYEGIHYGGSSRTFTESVDKLEDYGFRNSISSIKFN